MTPNEARAPADHLAAAARDLDRLVAELRITGAAGSPESLEIARIRYGLPAIIAFLTARHRAVRKLLEP